MTYVVLSAPFKSADISCSALPVTIAYLKICPQVLIYDAQYLWSHTFLLSVIRLKVQMVKFHYLLDKKIT